MKNATAIISINNREVLKVFESLEIRLFEPDDYRCIEYIRNNNSVYALFIEWSPGMDLKKFPVIRAFPETPFFYLCRKEDLKEAIKDNSAMGTVLISSSIIGMANQISTIYNSLLFTPDFYFYNIGDKNLKIVFMQNLVEITNILENDELSLSEKLREICTLIPYSFKGSSNISVKISLGSEIYKSENYFESENLQSEFIIINNDIVGKITIYGRENYDFRSEIKNNFNCLIDVLSKITKAIERHLQLKHVNENISFTNSLLNSIPFPVFYKGTDGKILGCNTACCEFLGKTNSELAGRKVDDFVIPEEAVRLKELDAKIISDGENQKIKFNYTKGDENKVLVFNRSVYRNIEGNIDGIINIVSDITEFSVLENSMGLYKEIFDQANIGMYIYKLEDCNDDTTLRMIECNRMAEIFTGIKRETVIGKLIDEAFPNLRSKGIPQLYAEIIRNKMHTNVGDVFYKDENIAGNWYNVRANIIPENRLCVSFIDISEKKKIEEDLNLRSNFYNVSSEVSRFISTVSNDEKEKGLEFALQSLGMISNANFTSLMSINSDFSEIEQLNYWTESVSGNRQFIKKRTGVGNPASFKKLLKQKSSVLIKKGITAFEKGTGTGIGVFDKAKSLLIVPLSSENFKNHFFCVVWKNKHPDYCEKHLSLFEYYAESVADALEVLLSKEY